MNNSKISIAALVLALAVALGAFGAHGLKPHLSIQNLEVYKTANLYHFVHGLAMLITAAFNNSSHKKALQISYYFMAIGILLFSGSLYVLALKDVWHAIPSYLGAITPIGGLFFMAGWFSLAYAYKQTTTAQ